MWYEFLVRVDVATQKKIIRQLRNWIESTETRHIVNGFAFNFYSDNPESLRIRFDCADEEKLKTVRMELENEVKRSIPDYSVKNNNERLWDEGKNSEQVYKAYELSSRLTFLAWNLIDSGRFSVEYFSSFFIGENNKEIVVKQIPFEFQFHFSHGLMNSLGINKYPDEAYVHFSILLGILTEIATIRAKQELINWMEKTLIMQ